MSQGMSSIIMIVLMFALLYFMMIRPEKKRKPHPQHMRAGLMQGDTLTTIGGLFCTVVAIDKGAFVIETSDDRVRLQFAKWALSTVGVQTGEQPETKKQDKEQKDEAKEEAETAEPAEIPAEPAAEAAGEEK